MADRGILDDTSLLDLLIKDLDVANEPWRITPYWETYHDRLIREIRKSGLKSLQNNYKLLKGFASGGPPTVITPNNNLKRSIFEIVPRLPVISKIFGEYNRLIHALYQQNIRLSQKIATQALIEIEEQLGALEVFGELTVGGSQEGFEFQKNSYVPTFVNYLARAADFYRFVPMEEVTSLIEIGPGLGWSTIAHRTLNPYLRTFVNIDLPATLYISTQFLKAVGGLKVINYAQYLADGKQISQDSGEHPVCYQLPIWCFEDINIPMDWLHNAFSFQEMEPNVVAAYAKHARSIVKRGAWLLSQTEGHKVGAGGQKKQVTYSVIETAFSSFLKREEVNLPKISKTFFDIDSEISRLYRVNNS
jgi:putative sugar O-methyltransferase